MIASPKLDRMALGSLLLLPLPNLFLIQLDTQAKMNSGAFEHRLFAATKRFVVSDCPRVSLEMSTQALFNLVSHLKHWAPGYATGCLEWAVPQLAGQTISPERDKNLAPIIGRYFFGKARGKAWIPDWKQFQSYWHHMKEDGLDCLSDPFIKATSYPTTDPFATPNSKPAPAANPTQPSTPSSSSGSTASSGTHSPVLRSALLSRIEQLEMVAQRKSVLRRGAQGSGVRAIQQVLLNAGFQLPTGTNGIFDEFMEAAVQTFQRNHGLTDDGVIGALTMAKLDAAAMA